MIHANQILQIRPLENEKKTIANLRLKNITCGGLHLADAIVRRVVCGDVHDDHARSRTSGKRGR